MGGLGESGQYAAQALGVIGVFGPVQGGEDIAPRGEAQVGKDMAGSFRPFPVKARGVIHDIPHLLDLGARQALPCQVARRRGGGGEQQVGGMVGQHPVDFLGHPPIEGAQARFHVRQGDMQFDRRQGAGEGGVGIAMDQDPVRPFVQEARLDGLQHAPGHGAVVEAGDAQVVSRLGDVELLEEDVRHVGIEVLAGVDDDLVDRLALAGRLHLGIMGADGAADGCGLDELGAGADDGQKLHGVMC